MTTKQLHVEFYFDISCPWCWITSRWLSEVQKHRDLDVTWQSFSLALKNNEVDGKSRTTAADEHREAHKVMRVIEAVRANHGDEMAGKLYTRLGKRWHNQKQHRSDVVLPSLRALNIPANLADAADDKTWDKSLQKSLDNAVKIVGEDVGVPTIILENHKTKSGFFGPVFTRLPDTADGLKIWDALNVVGTFPDFYELKRTRTHDADVRTTERLL